jgi:hypothetical protein
MKAIRSNSNNNKDNKHNKYINNNNNNNNKLQLRGPCHTGNEPQTGFHAKVPEFERETSCHRYLGHCYERTASFRGQILNGWGGGGYEDVKACSLRLPVVAIRI